MQYYRCNYLKCRVIDLAIILWLYFDIVKIIIVIMNFEWILLKYLPISINIIVNYPASQNSYTIAVASC